MSTICTWRRATVWQRWPLTHTCNGRRPHHRTFFHIPSPFDAFKPEVQTHQITKVVNVPPSRMFEVVSEVSKYKEFVPFVEDSYVSDRDGQELPSTAGLRVGWNQFNERFECKLACQRNKEVIAESKDILLFDLLYTRWSFKEARNFGNSPECEVTLDLAYRFKNPLYNTMSALFSDQVSKIMINAFEERAIATKVQDQVKSRGP